MGVVEYKISVIHSPNPKLVYQPLKEKMVDFTNFYINRLSQNQNLTINTQVVETYDEGLSNIPNDSDFILLISSGNRIYNSKDLLPQIISHFEQNPNLSMMGHILDRKEEWYEVHPQFVFIRTSHWNVSGRPLFGKDGDHSNNVVNVRRSFDNFHDDYTPLWVESEEGFNSYDRLRNGWLVMNNLLLSGFEIKPFDTLIRNMKAYCYPEYNSEKFYNLLKEKRYSEDIDYTKRVLLGQLSIPNELVWLFNTEEMRMTEDIDVSYDNILTTCSGFKFLDIIKSNLLNENGRVILYDNNTNSIEWFNYIMNSYHIDIIDLVMNKPSHIPLKLKRVERLFDSNGEPSKQLIELSNEVYDYFGGKNNFSKYLIYFRGLNYKIIKTNIVDHPEELLTHLKQGKTLINISNIYSMDYLNLFYGMEEREVMFNNLLNNLPNETKVVGRGIDTFYFEMDI